MRRETRKQGAMLAGGMGMGTALMYLFDPVQGRRRRARLRDGAVHLLYRLGDALGTTARDARHRAAGLVSRARSRTRERPPSDAVLVERVRAALGRAVSHPSSVIVTAHDGHVILSGPILAAEVDVALQRTRAVRGVRTVEQRFEVHEAADGVPGLQGGAPLPRRWPGQRLRRRWPPTTRLVAGMAGSALVLYAARRKGMMGTALGLAGATLVARSSTNREVTRLIGLSRTRRGVTLQKTITINAPVERVYGFFRQLENYPAFMRHVREVREGPGGLTHWVVDGPAGVPVEWEAEMTAVIPNELIAWRSVEGSAIAHTGRLRFEPAPRDATRVTIQMSYNPPAGMTGHVLASLLGANPKRRLDEDLVRVKTSIETGAPPRDAAAHRSE